MSATASRQLSVVDYYTDVVLPALAERLDAAFPEFGWRRDARGWVATNEEMTHRVLGARAQRVVAHGPAPRGFLVYGGDATLWTSYVNGGDVPRGERFTEVVLELARRAGVDTAPIQRPAPRDRQTDLLHDYFTLCRWELAADGGARAREYLAQRGLPAEALECCGLGVVPRHAVAVDCLRSCGYSEREIEQSGVLADSRWPGRICGAWRDEGSRIRTLWARSLESGPDETRYLYLRGATRANLPPYGVWWVLKETPRPRDLVLVEGLLDVHHLRARGISNIVAVGGTGIRPTAFDRLARLGFESVSISFDRDDAGRAAAARAVESAARAAASPAVFVVDPENLAPAKDPDAVVRAQPERWPSVVMNRSCGVVWRALEFATSIELTSAPQARRQALAAAGRWLGSLPPRLSLEQEDAVAAVAARCGYSETAALRTFRARFWNEATHEPGRTTSWAL